MLQINRERYFAKKCCTGLVLVSNSKYIYFFQISRLSRVDSVLVSVGVVWTRALCTPTQVKTQRIKY